MRFVTSGPVWAIIVANFCSDWGGYTLIKNIPTFYKEVLLFDIESVRSRQLICWELVVYFVIITGRPNTYCGTYVSL